MARSSDLQTALDFLLFANNQWFEKLTTSPALSGLFSHFNV